MAVWNDVGGDTICRKNYIEIIDGFEICNGNDSVSKSTQAYLHAPYFQTYSSLYYAAQSCAGTVQGFRIAPCADTIFVNLMRLKMRSQDSVHVRIGSFSGPILRRWGGNNLAGLPDSSKNFKYFGQELFIKYLPGTPNTPSPYWVNDSGFLLKWSIAPATFPAPNVSFASLDTVYSGYKMTFTNTTPGINIAFAWDLNGDNNYGLDNPIFPDSVTPNPTYTFFSFTPITKNVCLRARNCQGSSVKCKGVVVLPVAVAPLADFTVNKTTGFTTDTFYFTDISQYGSNNWLWTFNPNSVTYIMGTSATSQNPIVKLNVAQSYDVSMQATNPFGTTTKTKTAYITTLSYNTPTSIYPPQPSDMDVGISRVRMNGSAGKIDTITPLKDAAYHSYYLSSQTVVYRGGKYWAYFYRESAKDAENERAWIDWNRNTIYESNEEVLHKDAKNFVMDSFPVVVPNDAVTGLTRMLLGVSTDYSTINSNVATLGVYEDHGLIVAQDYT
jgi:PKD repeat protein